MRGGHYLEPPKMLGEEEAMDGRPYGDSRVNQAIEAAVEKIVVLALRPGGEDAGIPECIADALDQAAETTPALREDD